ncbi:MAG TPA: hypothetical protein QGI39_09575 [Gammaproteobacteria bacterium]|nr:hypothetical protein [Gammaproteobacteria bacterium]
MKGAGIDNVNADVVFVRHIILGAFGVDRNSMGEAQSLDYADDLPG